MWNKVKDKLPERDPRYRNLSKEVYVQTEKSGCKKAFLFLPDSTWYDSENCLIIINKVTKWREIL